MTDWLVQGLIPQGHCVLTVGEPHAMKSWMLEHLAICVASGQPFLGELDVKQQQVIIVDEDTPTEVLNTRIDRFCLGMNLSRTELEKENLIVRSMTGFQFMKNDDIDYLKLLSSISPPSLIIIDSLTTSSIGYDLNQTVDAMKVAKRWSKLKENGNTLIVSHHLSLKLHNGYVNTPDELERRVMGNTQLVAQCDTLLGVIRRKTKEASAGIISKSRRTLLNVSSLTMELREPKDQSWARLIMLEDSPDLPTDGCRRVLPYYTVDAVPSLTPKELSKISNGEYREQEARDILRELEQHDVLKREMGLGKDKRFTYVLNPDFLKPRSLSNEYWDALRV